MRTGIVRVPQVATRVGGKSYVDEQVWTHRAHNITHQTWPACRVLGLIPTLAHRHRLKMLLVEKAGSSHIVMENARGMVGVESLARQPIYL